MTFDYQLAAHVTCQAESIRPELSSLMDLAHSDCSARVRISSYAAMAWMLNAHKLSEKETLTPFFFVSHPLISSRVSSERASSMKLRVVCRKLYDYVRYDLKEIAFPSSLPDPPRLKKRRKLTWTERWSVLKEASRLYAASWVRDIGPDLRPNDYKKKDDVDDDAGADGEIRRGDAKSERREPSTLEDLAVAARGGMETLRPALQRVYMTRASAYRDALKSFIEGYQEGIKQVMERKEKNDPNKSA